MTKKKTIPKKKVEKTKIDKKDIPKEQQEILNDPKLR